MTQPGDTMPQHPSYGAITITRAPRGTSRRLFQSDIDNRQTMLLEVHAAQLLRSNSEDHILTDGLLISIEMTPHQFADAITRFGTTGPVTIRYVAGDSDMRPAPPVATGADTFADEYVSALEDIFE